MSDAGDRVRAAGDCLNDACNELSRARTVTSDEDVEEMLVENEEVAKDLEAALYKLAVSVDAAETEGEQ